MQAVERTLEILSAVATHSDDVTLNELSAQTGLSLSTVHRYALKMVELGYLERHSDKRFSLGGRGVALGANGSGPESMDARLRETLRDIRSATGETSFASQLAGGEVVCIAMERGTNPLQLSVRVGQTIPPLHAASARAVLAHVDPLLAEQAFSKAAPRDGDLSEFLGRLEAIRERGYDICDSEFDEGVWAVAAPVRSTRTGEMFGSVAVAGPASTFTEGKREQVIDLVRSASETLSARA